MHGTPESLSVLLTRLFALAFLSGTNKNSLGIMHLLAFGSLVLLRLALHAHARPSVWQLCNHFMDHGSFSPASGSPPSMYMGVDGSAYLDNWDNVVLRTAAKASYDSDLYIKCWYRTKVHGKMQRMAGR
jgi:hypothetical protein